MTRTDKHMYSWNGGPLMPGVTSVIKALDKSAPLIGWAQRETATAAVKHLETVRDHLAHRMPEPACGVCMAMGYQWEGPTQAAVNWLKRMPGYQRDASADLGSRVHALAHALKKKQPVEVTPDEAPFIDALLAWQAKHKPRYLASEYMVANLTVGYGGTGDEVMVIGEVTWAVDTKTGTGIYPETGLQLVALDRAEFAGRPGDPRRYKVPRGKRFGVLHVRPEGAELVPYQVGDDEWQAFLACRVLYRWLNEHAVNVMPEKKRRAA